MQWRNGERSEATVSGEPRRYRLKLLSALEKQELCVFRTTAVTAYDIYTHTYLSK